MADTETTYLNLAGNADSVKTRIAGQTFWRRYKYTTAALLDSEDLSGGGISFKARKYTYNTAFGVPTGIHVGGAVTSFGINKDLQDTATTFPGGDKVTRVIDPVHATTEISTTAAYNDSIARSIGYDSLNRITLQTEGTGSTGNQYVYDAHGRLVSVAPVQNPAPPSSCSGDTTTLIVDPYGNSCVSGGGWTALAHQFFVYDSAGNRIDSGGTYTTGNRITAWGGCSYLTDADGNVTSRTCGGSTVTFTWSAESRLTSYTVGGQTINLKYNAGGQLVRKDSSSTTKSNFLWDGDNPLAEVNAAGTGSIAEYSYYGPDQLHALMVGGTEYNAQTDALGDVIALTDNSSNVKRTYGYDAWGTTTSGTDTRPFSNADRARWKGALWLGPELDVYYMRNRWYEPGSGRFLSEDPHGVQGGLNPYTYGADDPVNHRDPTGEFCFSDAESVTFESNGQWVTVLDPTSGGSVVVWAPQGTVTIEVSFTTCFGPSDPAPFQGAPDNPKGMAGDGLNPFGAGSSVSVSLSPDKSACHAAIADAALSGALDLLTLGVASEARAAANLGELFLREGASLGERGVVRGGILATSAGLAQRGAANALKESADMELVDLGNRTRDAYGIVSNGIDWKTLVGLIPVPGVGTAFDIFDAVKKCTQSGL